MLIEIPLVTFFLFSVLYPLVFLISVRDPLKKGFHHFHLGMPAVVGGLSVVGLWMFPAPPALRTISTLWLGLMLAANAYYWRRETVNIFVVTAVSALGVGIYFFLHQKIFTPHAASFALGLLAGLILAAVFYAMNLGHWYLNVHGLPLSHLKRAVSVLGVFLVLRLLWDLAAGTGTTLVHQGEVQSLWTFMRTLDGLFLWVAVFFGTVFPLASLYFVWGTLKLKNTQSATGILYVTLTAVLIGDIAYKYYLFRFGLAL